MKGMSLCPFMEPACWFKCLMDTRMPLLHSIALSSSKSILKGVKFPVNRKVFRWFIVLLISFIFVLICYFIITNIQSEEEDVINDAITIEGKISDVVVHGERATLYLNIDDKIVALNLQEDTSIKNSKGQNCTYDDMLPGVIIEAVVNQTVWYETWRDVETGEQNEMSVYYKCYEILIK